MELQSKWRRLIARLLIAATTTVQLAHEPDAHLAAGTAAPQRAQRS